MPKPAAPLAVLRALAVALPEPARGRWGGRSIAWPHASPQRRCCLTPSCPCPQLYGIPGLGNQLALAPGPICTNTSGYQGLNCCGLGSFAAALWSRGHTAPHVPWGIRDTLTSKAAWGQAEAEPCRHCSSSRCFSSSPRPDLGVSLIGPQVGIWCVPVLLPRPGGVKLSSPVVTV